MADPAKDMAREIHSFVQRLHDGQIRRMYRRIRGDERSREFPLLRRESPVVNFNQMWAWALVNEHDRRDLA